MPLNKETKPNQKISDPYVGYSHQLKMQCFIDLLYVGKMVL